MVNRPVGNARARSFVASISLTCLPLIGCASADDPAVVLATTTSIDDSGLLPHLLRAYQTERPSARVRPLAVGSGEALELGRRGDADLLIVHSPWAEKQFMDEGRGESRVQIMYNDFVVVGPPDDPAAVAGVGSPGEAFRAIGEAGVPFLSRGDDSGTHRRELEIWSDAGTTRASSWYLEAGQGMGPLLQMASERRAYTLSDRATFYSMQPQLDLEVVYEGDALLQNVYSVILVRRAGARSDARDLFEWLTSEAGAQAIAAYRDGGGRKLFHPLRPADAAWEAPALTDATLAEDPASPRAGIPASQRETTEESQNRPDLRQRLLCRSVPPGRADPSCE